MTKIKRAELYEKIIAHPLWNGKTDFGRIAFF